MKLGSKKRSERLLARYWRPKMHKIVSDYADEINQIDWDRARYDDDYVITEIAQAIAKRDASTCNLFEHVRENQEQILNDEIRKIQKRRKHIYEKFGCLFSSFGCLSWLVYFSLLFLVLGFIVQSDPLFGVLFILLLLLLTFLGGLL